MHFGAKERVCVLVLLARNVLIGRRMTPRKNLHSYLLFLKKYDVEGADDSKKLSAQSLKPGYDEKQHTRN